MIASGPLIALLFSLIVKISCDRDGFADLAPDNAVSAINITGDDATETHHTTCKITTERLVANAQATFTRVLTGACNAKNIEERLEKLENSLSERLEEIKDLILSCDRDKNSGRKHIFPQNENLPIEGNNFEEDYPPARRVEVSRFNNSVRDISDGKAYTYYWRVFNVSEKLLQWETGRSERSSTFYVGSPGYAMYLKFTPKYFPDGTIFASVGLTEGIHDSELVWPFPLRIRIKILDVGMRSQPDDRSSRLWDPATICSSYFWGKPGALGGSDNPECVGLSVPRQLLIGEHTRSSAKAHDAVYVWKDSLIVELSVYL